MNTQSLPPDLCVVVVSYNNAPEITACLESIEAACGQLNYQIIVVDNASHDGCSTIVAQQFPQVLLIESKVNLGFAAGNNLAFQHSQARYFALINPDARPEPLSLQAAVHTLDLHPQIGMAGGRLLSESGADQPSARCFPSLLNDFLVLSGLANRFARHRFFGRFDRGWADPGQAARVDWVPGAFTLIRHSSLHLTGDFDERFFLYYEEVDLCRRMYQHGFEVWYLPDWRAVHIGGVSSSRVEGAHFNAHGSQLSLWRMRSALLYYRKHHGLLVARLANDLERGWHGLRAWRNRLMKWRSQATEKANESRALCLLLRRAWRDTAGGLSSPPRPWSGADHV